MLSQLSIKNFALIDTLKVDFSDSLNLLTGETGAGKSIIVDAVSLLLGARAQNEFIRAGEEYALVEGVFIIPSKHPVRETIERFGFLLEENILILTRELNRTGNNFCRVNNRITTLSNFKDIGSQLIDIYGQHDFQNLSNPEEHISLIDSLGDKDFLENLRLVEYSFKEYKELELKLTSFRESIMEREKKIDFLKFQINEIKEINPIQNEDLEIESELEVLNNYENIFSALQESYSLLYGSNSAYDKLSKANSLLEEVIEYDVLLKEYFDKLSSITLEVEDLAQSLRAYSQNINYDQTKINLLEERNLEIKRIKRKYGSSIEEVLSFCDKAEKELNLLEFNEEHIKETEKELEVAKKAYLSKALELSKKRRLLSKNLETKIHAELKELEMENTTFEVKFQEKDFSKNGIDDISFWLSANPGEPVKPLSKIASGGEMSRIMLAFKVVVAQKDFIGTLIFDEVDTGIGGTVIQKVAEKLAFLAKKHQVFCVTHSPTIASYANRHFKIEKEVSGSRTKTKIQTLEDKLRVKEIARMLGHQDKETFDFALKMLRENDVKWRNYHGKD